MLKRHLTTVLVQLLISLYWICKKPLSMKKTSKLDRTRYLGKSFQSTINPSEEHVFLGQRKSFMQKQTTILGVWSNLKSTTKSTTE